MGYLQLTTSQDGTANTRGIGVMHDGTKEFGLHVHIVCFIRAWPLRGRIDSVATWEAHGRIRGWFTCIIVASGGTHGDGWERHGRGMGIGKDGSVG